MRPSLHCNETVKNLQRIEQTACLSGRHSRGRCLPTKATASALNRGAVRDLYDQSSKLVTDSMLGRNELDPYLVPQGSSHVRMCPDCP